MVLIYDSNCCLTLIIVFRLLLMKPSAYFSSSAIAFGSFFSGCPDCISLASGLLASSSYLAFVSYSISSLLFFVTVMRATLVLSITFCS